MTKDPVGGRGAAKCEVCSTDGPEGNCRCSEQSVKGAQGSGKTGSTNLIDFKQRASEMRIKGTLTGTVSSLEATRALAFGLMHLRGEGVPRDPAKAAKFLATAAKGGIPQAKHELALLHIAGTSVPYDAEYAITLLQSAATQDDYAASAVSLAELYIFGKHCAKNIEG